MTNLKKILVIFVLTVLTFNSNSYSEIVKKLSVEGNERISAETIAVFADISLEKNYESKDINLIIKKLYETKFFSDISVVFSNGILKISVKENPVINRIIFEGESAVKYKDEIKTKLVLSEKASFVKTNVESDINIITQLYRSLGYYFVAIDLEVEKLTKNRVNLIYTIEKGKKAKIAKIYFLGDKKIRERRLRDVITSQESKVWKVFSKNVYLNKGRVELDKRLLKNYYKNKGYYEVDISSTNVEYSEGEGFVLTFSINAGKRYKFNKIFANVSESLDKSAFVSLEEDFNKVVGDYYSTTKLTKILEKIDKLSEQKELQFINHKVEETLSENSIDIKIDIFEGEKVLIERILIAGNTVTNDSVIRGEMIVDEGDPYSALLINKSINNLRARRIFGNVTQAVSPGTKPDLRIVEITVEERATGEISAGAGIGSDGTSFMFMVNENNWLGRGIGLSSTLNLTSTSVSGGLNINNPNYKYSGNALNAGLTLATIDNTNTSGYKSKRTKLSLGTEFEQYENIYFSPSIGAGHEDVTVQKSASASVKKMGGNFSNIDFNYGVAFDQRNQTYNPTGGYWAKFIQKIPLLQDSSSLLNGVNFNKYHGFSEDVIGTVKFFGRSIHGLDKDTRLTSRLFLPQSRLRGFDTQRTGPKDGNDYVGGNYTTSLAFEAKLPNLLPESYKTDFSVFLDSANVWAVDYSDSIDDSSKIRSSVGLAANVFTAIGPLSFTLAQNITKDTNDVTEVFNFRLGTSF